jgi:hypothetical protein
MKINNRWLRSAVVPALGVLLYVPMFSTGAHGGSKSSCVAPFPINPVVNACTSSTAQTGCIDSTFGTNGAALLLDTKLAPQGAVRLQPRADGSQKIVIAVGGSATVASSTWTEARIRPSAAVGSAIISPPRLGA